MWGICLKKRWRFCSVSKPLLSWRQRCFSWWHNPFKKSTETFQVNPCRGLGGGGKTVMRVSFISWFTANSFERGEARSSMALVSVMLLACIRPPGFLAVSYCVAWALQTPAAGHSGYYCLAWESVLAGSSHNSPIPLITCLTNGSWSTK